MGSCCECFSGVGPTVQSLQSVPSGRGETLPSVTRAQKNVVLLPSVERDSTKSWEDSAKSWEVSGRANTKRFYTARSFSFLSIKSVSRVPTIRVWSNPNLPEHYEWTLTLLRSIAHGRANRLGCRDVASGQSWTPIFLVLGSCPSALAGMQALMFVTNSSHRVDFWWIKPNTQGDDVEAETLNLHLQGPHKNCMSSASRKAFQPLADFFVAGQSRSSPNWTYGISDGQSTEAPRGFLKSEDLLYTYIVWAEDWASPFAWTKFVRGKIVYQKDPAKELFFERPFELRDGVMQISAEESVEYDSLIPAVRVKSIDPQESVA